MARVRIINPQGKSGTIDDSELQIALSSGYTMPSQPSQPAQSGGFLTNLIGSLVAPFKRTGERVVGAGQELFLNRRGKVKEAEALMQEAQKRMMAGKMDFETERLLNEAERLSKGAQKETIASRNQEVLTDPLQIAKDTAAILSYGVPTKAATTVFGKTLPAMGLAKGGALSGALSGGGYSKEESLGGILKDVGIGAGVGYGLGKWGEAREAKKLAKVKGGAEDNLLTKTGLEAKRNVVRPQAGGGPESILNEDEMIKYLNEKGITGTPSKMRYGIANKYKDLYKQVGDIIDTPGATRNSYDINTVKNAITQQVEEKGSFYIPGDKTFKKLFDRELALLEKKAVDGYVSDKAIYETLGNLNNQLSSAFKKVGGTSSSAVTQIEGVRLDTRQALTDLLGIARPELQPLTSEMSILHKLEPGLKSASMETANLFGLPIPGIGQAFMGAQSKVGDALLALGGQTATKAAPGAVSTIAPNILQQLSKQTSATPAIVGSLLGKDQVPPATQPTMGTGGMQQPTSGTTQPTDVLSMLGLDMQSLMLLLALPVKEQNAILTELIGSKVKGTGDVGNTQLIADAATQAYQALSRGDVKTGMIGGRAEKVKSQLGLGGDQATLDFNVAVQNIFSAIAKARGGTALTESEKQDLKEYLPQTGDSKQILETKLRYIIQNPEVVVLGK